MGLTNRWDLRRPARTAGREVPLVAIIAYEAAGMGSRKFFGSVDRLAAELPMPARNLTVRTGAGMAAVIVSRHVSWLDKMCRSARIRAPPAGARPRAVVGDHDIGRATFFVDRPLGGFAPVEFGVGPAALPCPAGAARRAERRPSARYRTSAPSRPPKAGGHRARPPACPRPQIASADSLSRRRIRGCSKSSKNCRSRLASSLSAKTRWAIGGPIHSCHRQ